MPIVDYTPFQAYYVAGCLKGVFVGGCVERGDGSSFRRKAHTHWDIPRASYGGWICVRSAKRLYNVTGKPTLLMWHELSHILCGPRHWHDQVWQKTMRKLCGRVDVQRKPTGGRR